MCISVVGVESVGMAASVGFIITGILATVQIQGHLHRRQCLLLAAAA